MKKKYPIIYLPPAERDLEGIVDYIRRDSPGRAVSFLKTVDRKISRLGSFPLSGTVPSDPFLRRKGYRLAVIGQYLAFYRFEKKRVFIDRVLHGRRRYDFLFR